MSDRFARIETLYHAARRRPPEERAAYLAEACGSDTTLQRDVETLLAQQGAGVLTSVTVTRPALASGTVIGAYRIVEQIGVGGMGEVYRATDTNLKRDVALKVLPAAVASDVDRLVRFQREAELLATFDHPNIAHIHGLEKASGEFALVMELVDGPTLADRIAQGAIPLDEALRIAKQLVAALAAAHQHGIIHRDLKPANIKVRDDGTVKVLDFGLAKAIDARTGPIAASSPTMSMQATAAGVILGTAAYMSPEQALGKPVDTRTDIWAFGCVVYELLSGDRAFGGASAAETIAAVIHSEPDWSRLPSGTPSGIVRVVRRCLTKAAERRVAHIRDVGLDLDEAIEGTPGETVRGGAPARAHLMWLAACLGIAGAVWAGTVWNERRASIAPPPEMRLDIVTPPTTDPLSLALSPDGQKIVFVATSAGKPMLWLRRLADETSARPILGTEYALRPFWAPDSHAVGFFAGSEIEQVDLGSGSIRRISSMGIVPSGATWNADGTVLFPVVPDSPLYRTSFEGGVETQLPNPEPQGVGQRDPVFLPDGRHFLYYVAEAAPLRGVYLGDLQGGHAQRLVEADSAAAFASTGHLLFVNQGTVLAQRLDLEHGKLLGSPSAVADHIAFSRGGTTAALSASAAGPIAYRTGSTGGKRQLVWLDRHGRPLSSIGEPESLAPESMSMSRDGRRVAMMRTVGAKVHIWTLELDTGRAVPQTSGDLPELSPVLSPDDQKIAFAAPGATTFDLWQLSIENGQRKPLLTTGFPKQPTDWSPDGRYLLYRTQNSARDWDVFALRLDGGDPIPVCQGPFDQRDAQFSPDGKWVAYQDNTPGRFEVYVRPFLRPGPPRPVSTAGGSHVRWRRDGAELFYIAGDGQLMAVPFDAKNVGHEVGAPLALFPTHVGSFLDITTPHYVPSSDGQRFLMSILVDENAPPITVILNWKPPADGQKPPGR